jgi:hypothetical protein
MLSLHCLRSLRAAALETSSSGLRHDKVQTVARPTRRSQMLCDAVCRCTLYHRSGTYGESECPNIFLGLEVCCLAGVWSTCCSFNVTRRLVTDDRNLGDDPTEVRVNDCIRFFSRLARQCCMLGLCVGCSACLIGCCAPDSEGAQECSGEAGRAASACRSCARTCWRGIWSVKNHC